MLDHRTRAAARRYFARPPRWPLACIALGVLLLAAGRGAAPAGAVLAAAGGGAALRRAWRRVPDAEYDRWRGEALHAVAATQAPRAWQIRRDELVGEPPYVCFYAPTVSAVGAQASRRGRDGAIRFNPIRFTIIGFGERQLFAYLGVLDLITGDLRCEQADAFAYHEVASVSTRRDACQVTWKGEQYELDDAETLAVHASGGGAVELAIRSPRWARILGGGDLPSAASDHAISVVRSAVRQRRRGLVTPTRDDGAGSPQA